MISFDHLLPAVLGLSAGGAAVLTVTALRKRVQMLRAALSGTLAVTIILLAFILDALLTHLLPKQAIQDLISPPSKLELASRKCWAILQADPVVAGLLKNMTSAEEQAWTNNEARHGLRFLPSADLAAWANIRVKLTVASPSLCSALWKGGMPGDQMFRAFAETLTASELETFVSIAARAACLQAHPPTIDASPEADSRFLFERVFADLGPEQRTRFETIIRGETEVNDDDACWAFTTVQRYAAESPVGAATRERLLRGLAGLG